MRTFIEIKEQVLEIEFNAKVEANIFASSGFYKLKRIEKAGDILEDIIFVDKKTNHVIFITPINFFEELQLEIDELDIIRQYEDGQKDKDLGAFSLENNVKAEEALENLKSRIDKINVLPKTELPTAQLISDDLVPASFVLEFTKALLGKK